jgi:transcriptional regulator with XRE-family HTH domain
VTTTPDDVRRTRGRLGLSLRGLAKALDVSHMTVWNWEQGVAEPPSYLWRALRDLETESSGTRTELRAVHHKRSAKMLHTSGGPTDRIREIRKMCVDSLKFQLATFEEQGLSPEDAKGCADQLGKLRATVEKLELHLRETAR